MTSEEYLALIGKKKAKAESPTVQMAPKQKRAQSHEESRMQRAFVAKAKELWPWLEYLLFAIPNGGKRGGTEAKILIGEGVVPGVADLFLALPTSSHHGFFLEAKTKDGVQSPKQKLFEAAVTEKGYEYYIFRSAADGIQILESLILLHKRLKT